MAKIKLVGSFVNRAFYLAWLSVPLKKGLANWVLNAHLFTLKIDLAFIKQFRFASRHILEINAVSLDLHNNTITL